jgi:hypothetical protein
MFDFRIFGHRGGDAGWGAAADRRLRTSPRGRVVEKLGNMESMFVNQLRRRAVAPPAMHNKSR